MSLRFLLGRSGTGKTAAILDEIRGELISNPEGSPIIYLVPEQMTFLSEYKLIQTPGLAGMIRGQVFSFTRLAWRVLQETGGMSRIHLDSVGVNMLIRKIMDEKKDEMKIFRRSAEKPGFIAHMEEMITEFKRYCINPEEVASFNGKQDEAGGLQDKLHDLEMIYEAFETELAGKYLDSEDYFKLLVEKMAHSSYIADAEIYIDGFYSLTPQEMQIVQELMKLSKKVTIALTLDQPYRQLPPDDLHLFRQTGTTYHSIYSLALQSSVPVEQDSILGDTVRYRNNEGLKHLEGNFNIRPAKTLPQSLGITISPAVSRRAEIEGTARTIVKLVREDGFRWRDIAILLRNGESYHDLIQTIFKDYQIPIFIDSKKTMLNHPFIELLRSTIEIVMTNWRYEPVFRAIKTEMLIPVDAVNKQMRDKFDSLENYVLSRGMKGDKWTSKEKWVYRKIRGLELEERTQTTKEREKEEDLNELKDMIAGPIIRFSKRLKQAVTGRDYCEAVFLYAEELKIPAKLEKLSHDADQAGDLITARQHEQAWKAVIDLLDQFVEMLGEEKLNLKQFAAIMETGFDSLKFAIVPPAIDQVVVANLDLSRVDDVKTTFVLGLNEGILPAKLSEEGIFSDRDRTVLARGGMELAPSSKIRMLDEEFVAYMAFATPSERLYLSYPLADEEGKSLLPSTYIKRVRDVLPDAKEVLYSNDPSEMSAENQVEHAVNYRVALSYLTAQLQLKKKSYPMDPLWWDVYNAYLDNEQVRREAIHVLSSLFYQNKTAKLARETSKALYGESITTSVSRMEMFNSCPFSHYAAYGLKLQERKIYRLDAPDIGEMFHAALKFISDYLHEENVAWSSLTKEQCLELARQAVEMLAPRLQNQILLSTNRHHYLKRKLERVIGRASVVLSEQAKESGFSPIGLELGFGKDGELPPLSFTLNNGTSMELIGRIDRVDQAEENDSIYLRVLDYKSSPKDLNLSEVYYGLALQMLTYLDIIISHSAKLVGKEATPAGVLYFHVHNPIVKSKGRINDNDIEDAIFKSFKMKGLILGESNAIQLMDRSLETGTSDIIPAGFKKDGSLHSASRVASRNEFTLLKNHVRTIYQEAGNAIVGGAVDITPYKLKKEVPCTFCSYKSVCQFDQSLEENQFRNLPAKKPNEVLELLRQEETANE